MRVTVLGGTRFIGAAIVEELAAYGHELLLVHRGEHEPDGLPEADHLHAERRDLPHLRGALDEFGPEALVDACAMTAADAETALAALGDMRLLVLSSMDVYRVWGSLLAGTETDPVPVDETSAVREQRYPYRGHPRYGREEGVLRRVRAGRARIPTGAGTFLWTRGYVRDVAAGVRLALESEACIGEVLNLGEHRTWSMALWARHVLEAAGASAELVRVPDVLLPDDLRLFASMPQHVLVSSAKARDLLGWEETDPHEALGRSVAWHLANPPDADDGTDDFGEDDKALAAAQ